MFPDALNPTDTTPRNTVTVLVQTTPPVSGQSVRLKAFDVDDPTPPDLNPGGVLDANDIFQLPSGNDNRGTPQAGQLAQTVLTLDSQGKATTTFTVTRQPGDNFRVAAVLDTGAAATNHLNLLQVTSENAEYYVGSDTNAIPGFLGGISPMLTVWRKLHLEFDSMTAPPASGPEALYWSGTITSGRTNYPVAGRSQLSIRYEFNLDEGANIFEQGKVEISGVGTFKVRQSSTLVGLNGRTSTFAEIEGVPSGTLVGRSVNLYDDDDRFLATDALYPSSLNLQLPPLPLDFRSGEFVQTNQTRFAPAYIQLVDGNAMGWNTQPTIPFRRHAEAALTGGPFDSGNQQFKGADRPEFWAYTLIFGYQPSIDDDGEPDAEPSLDGITVKKGLAPFGYTVVYVESIRDQAFVNVPASSFTLPLAVDGLRRSYSGELYTTIAHELGHAPGDTSEASDHAERGIMLKNANNASLLDFSPATLKRFRSAVRWAE